ncbi:hypothetical protein [Aquisphaera insulae]|uniref:hypothetical protein n=1 Tax=Aquisphaera insulae TaxID=2712864 RepID=UPI0013EE3488|nr:hypothetical protein [Aquisphaera insulae]
MILGYFGPETVMPVTSIIATVAAMVAMFGRGLFRLVLGGILLRMSRKRMRKAAGQAGIGIGTVARPHFSLGEAHVRSHGATGVTVGGEAAETADDRIA